MSIDRRSWLKQSSLMAAGLGLSPILSSAEEKRFFAPAGPIWLNSNENAYGPSEATKRAMSEALANSNRYPDDKIPVLKQQVADFWQIGKENILFGAGSSEILGLTSILVSSIKGTVVTAEPSYRVWNGQAETAGLQFKRVPLTPDRTLDLQGMMSSIDNDTRMVYVCNPNNPVGTYVDDHLLRAFVDESSKKCMVLIDEAYTEFGEVPSLKDIAIKNPNVIVAKTFSKIYGLAGARIGYAITHPDTIRRLSGFQSWSDMSISMATCAAASAALKDQAFVKHCREKTKQAREMCYKTFKELNLDYIPSHTSFILFNIDKIKGDFGNMMLTKNIYVQYRDHFGGKWCRVSMGTVEEMQQFCNVLKEIAG